MSEGLRQRYRDAEERVEAVNDKIRRASNRRLAELMKLPPKQRLAQIEDQILTAEDRKSLRQSIAGSLRHRRWHALLFASKTIVASFRRWRQQYFAVVVIALAIIPLVAAAMKAKESTYKAIMIPEPIELDWRLPSGLVEREVVPAGHRLAVSKQSGSFVIARRWIPGQGYAISHLNIINESSPEN